MSDNNTVHWADFTAERIIQQKGKNKSEQDTYVLASGITPSGVVHFGNFRETITVDFVARALRQRGKKVRFIFSWDDFDTFRKVPANMPNQEMLKDFLFRPIVHTPDPFGRDESYAAHHEKNYEAQLKKMGIEVETLYQAKKYQSGTYKNQILTTLEKRDEIVAILNKHRSTPLPESWMPVSVYCEKCDRDDVDHITWQASDKDTLGYRCNLCGHVGKEHLPSTSRVKLPWRMDWPMRWTFEKVDFEPGGKDHSSEGGSYTTAKELVSAIYGGEVPIYLQYDFVSIKGMGGKMSSSKGNLVTVNDVLEIYTPEMIRWIFASYKSNVDFGLSFDLDVIKNYEDFDRQEKLAAEGDLEKDKKAKMAKRVMELASLDGQFRRPPFRPGFRHLCNILQINDGNVFKAQEYYKNELKTAEDVKAFVERAEKAWFWIDNYAPEDFRYRLNKEASSEVLKNATDAQKEFLSKLAMILKNEWEQYKEDKDLHERLYALIHEIQVQHPTVQPQELFTFLYQVLISRERGPKLASFLLAIGKERCLKLLAL